MYSFVALLLWIMLQEGKSYDAFDRDCVQTHNELRRAHNAQALTWSTRLAQEAQLWAEKLAIEDKLLHDYETMIKNGEGENIAWQKPPMSRCRVPKQSHCLRCKDVVLRWYNEVNNYNFTANEVIDKARPVKHFTQIVWKDTRELGIGTSTSLNHGVIIVARYRPIGDTNGLSGYINNIEPPVRDCKNVQLVIPGTATNQDNPVCDLPKGNTTIMKTIKIIQHIPGTPNINIEQAGNAGKAIPVTQAPAAGSMPVKPTTPASKSPAPPTQAPTEMPVTCGQRRESRIVGGEKAYPGAWPWQVGLKLSPDEDIFCGASLIKKQWIVTASHCVYDFLKRKKIPPLEVVLGEFDKGNEEGQEITSKVDKIIMHEKYSHKTLDYDIALLRLELPLEAFNPFVRPICLPDETTSWAPGHQCYVTGFGLTQEGGIVAPVLMQARIPLVSQEICKKTFKDKENKITDRMLCAGFAKGGIDACQGDSGGPLTCKFDTRWYLTGVVSWGIGCANPNAYGVYSNVTLLMDWIQETIAKETKT